jgi:glycerol uptake facilitator-like aquaporin
MYAHGLVEYLGTCLLVGAVAFTSNPMFVVAALALAIGLGGKISNGYFNPAITVWAFLVGKMSQSRAVEYLVAQLAAALTIWGAHSMIKV